MAAVQERLKSHDVAAPPGGCCNGTQLCRVGGLQVDPAGTFVAVASESD